MAKSTNHTAHNQSYKNHRNGIKKPDRLGKGQRRKAKGVSCQPTPACAPPPFPSRSPWAAHPREGRASRDATGRVRRIAPAGGESSLAYLSHRSGAHASRCRETTPLFFCTQSVGRQKADAPPCDPPPLSQMDPKFLRNQRFCKKWMGKGRGADEE